MNILKDYIKEIIYFFKDENPMDKIDYIVYIFILISMLFIVKKFQNPVCILNNPIRKIFEIIYISVKFIIISTMIYSLYKLIRKKYNKKYHN